MSETVTLDEYDRKILRAVSVDGRVTITALAKQVGLSKTPCQIRLRRLENAGIITGYRALLNAEKLGINHVAFVEVHFNDTREEALVQFNKAVGAVPEIEQCHMIAGNYDYLLKVRTQGITNYRRILGEVISSLPHVARTSTFVSMESVKDEMLKGGTGVKEESRLERAEEEIAHLRLANEELSGELLVHLRRIEAMEKHILLLGSRFSSIEENLEGPIENQRPPHW